MALDDAEAHAHYVESMSAPPVGPPRAADVLTEQHYANFIGVSEPTFDAEGQVAALLAAAGGPAGITEDGTLWRLEEAYPSTPTAPLFRLRAVLASDGDDDQEATDGK